MTIISKLQTKFIILSLALNALLVKSVKAATTPSPLDRMKNTASQVGYPTVSLAPQSIIVNIILAVLGFTAMVFCLMIIYSGYQLLTSGGNEEKIKDAKKRLYYAVIGFVVIAAAYAITVFVWTVAIKSTTTGYYSY